MTSFPRILHLSTFDARGGAARSTIRIHRALLEHGLHSEVHVLVRESDAPSVHQLTDIPFSSRLAIAQEHLSMMRRQATGQFGGYSSTGQTGAQLTDWINNHPADIVHLHWIQFLLSIRDIASITKPMLWTIHDLWPLAGMRHMPDKPGWHRDFAHRHYEPAMWDSEADRNTWELKARLWTTPFQIITPSRWMADQVSESRLMASFPLEIIPHPLNGGEWKNMENATARRLLGLPAEGHLVAFGSAGGITDPLKGFDLLIQAMNQVQFRQSHPGIHIVTFGGLPERLPLLPSVPVIHLGHISNPDHLRAVYSATDVLAVPSRMETFGLVAAEALACGTPAVAFDQTGLADIITHQRTGYLAHPLDTADYARGIQWALNATDKEKAEIKKACQTQATTLWHPTTIAASYTSVYQSVLSKQSLP